MNLILRFCVWTVFMLMSVYLSTTSVAKALRSNDPLYIDLVIEHTDTSIDKDLIRAIAWVESRWRQYDEYGMSYNTDERDWGIMQVNEDTVLGYFPEWEMWRIRMDPEYNIYAGIRIFEEKVRYIEDLRQRNDWLVIATTYDLLGRTTEEMAIKAYNGMQPSWEYVDAVRKAQKEKPWLRLLRGEEHE